jgi:membrane protease YdiL (CAAX protease family)
MFANLTGPQRAAIFYVIALGLAVVIGAVSGTFGEFTPLVTMLTPAVALVIMMLLTGEGLGRSGLASLGVTTLGLRGWWLAILGPAALLVASYALLIALGMASFHAPDVSGGWLQIIVNMSLGLGIGLVFAFTEEVGWRGYMLPRLAAIGVVPAMLIVGFLHGVWHLPIMLMTPFYHSGANFLIVVPMFLITLTLAGIFFGFLRVWTGSVWPVAIAHAVHNFFWSLGSEFVVADKPETMEYLGGESGILEIAGLVVLALILVPLLRGRRSTPVAPSGAAVA